MYNKLQPFNLEHLSDYLLQDNINAELGVSASEDAILDTLSERAEKEILAGGSDEKYLIGLCAPFLTKLCRNFSLMQKVILLVFLALQCLHACFLL